MYLFPIHPEYQVSTKSKGPRFILWIFPNMLVKYLFMVRFSNFMFFKSLKRDLNNIDISQYLANKIVNSNLQMMRADLKSVWYDFIQSCE